MTRHCWRCAGPLDGAPPTTCARCGEVHYANPKPCGDAIVVRAWSPSTEILLVRRARDPDAGAWDVPGGFCEADEHPMRAAERELYEEAGVRGRAIAHVGTWMDAYGPPADDGFVIHTAVTGYLVELEDPGAAPRADPSETTEVGWFSLARLPEPLAFARRARVMLAAARVLLAGPAPGRALPDRTW